MDGSSGQHPRRRPHGDGEPENAPEPAGSGRYLLADLHLCPECNSGLVHPLDWIALDDVHWRVELRCPECEWRSVDVYEQSVLDRFDQILDAAMHSILTDLRKLERMNMEDELRRFEAALADELVVPEDL